MKPPILITGLPRSGTSLVTGIFALSGAFTGKTAEGGPYNPYGSVENTTVKDRVVKPLLSMMGNDPLGLNSLPPLKQKRLVEPKHFRDQVETIMVEHGWDGKQPYVFKDAKMALIFDQWRKAFPDAKWYVVRRPVNDVIRSCLRAEPMTRRMGVDYGNWTRWAAHYTDCVNHVIAETQCTVIEPENMVFKDLFRMKKVIEAEPGLVWREDVIRDWIDPKIWNKRK